MEPFSKLLAFVRRIYRSPVDSPHKGQWRGEREREIKYIGRLGDRGHMGLYYGEQQGSWQAVLCDAPKNLAILDHFYHLELLQNSTEVQVLVPGLRMCHPLVEINWFSYSNMCMDFGLGIFFVASWIYVTSAQMA